MVAKSIAKKLLFIHKPTDYVCAPAFRGAARVVLPSRVFAHASLSLTGNEHFTGS